MSAPRLRLCAPGLLGPLPGSLPPGLLPELPGLETWLARGRRGALDPLPEPEASGPLAWLGEGGDPGGRYWARARPVHLHPEAGGVRLLPLDLEACEAARLETDLADLLAEHGVTLHCAASGRWYLAMDTPLPPRPAAHATSARFVESRLPRDRESLAWAAVFNEIEMVLADHPINRDREARGAWPVTGLWAWGSARLPEPPAVFPWQLVLSDDPAWQGVARLVGREAAELACAGPPVPGDDTLLIVPWAQEALDEGDGAGWIDAVARVEAAYAAPAVAGLQQADGDGRRWSRLELDPGLAGAGWVLERRSLWRLWRRRRPLRKWVRGPEADG